ncbi:hypothetical protein QVD17_03416 [Tagetes erecta]|uniref:Uncharacterized protein n=1 Tax=Tagetes erecta TaxID=13708 RepID=A0AAD8LFP1_TARER|nr:hypothetical protein QVD17_03416 [Tagetes erecta]
MSLHLHPSAFNPSSPANQPSPKLYIFQQPPPPSSSSSSSSSSSCLHLHSALHPSNCNRSLHRYGIILGFIPQTVHSISSLLRVSSLEVKKEKSGANRLFRHPTNGLYKLFASLIYPFSSCKVFIQKGNAYIVLNQVASITTGSGAAQKSTYDRKGSWANLGVDHRFGSCV